MGNFRIVIDAIGGHGQDRGKKDGEIVDFTENSSNHISPEAIFKKFIEEQQAAGTMHITKAVVHHWPNPEHGETPVDGQGNPCITDNLLTSVRSGNF